ncbi:MAG: hypothetical protein OXF62_16775 [Caldilineaceae bacterium]|nr:hypothetical protein [Caldilineaceae bacterium]
MSEDFDGRGRVNVDVALLAYLVPLLGSAYILSFRKEDEFGRFHAVQGLTLVLALVLAPAAWALFSGLVAWIPFGGVVAAYVFALVVAVYLAAIVSWFAGIVNVLRGRRVPVPVFGRILR